MNACAKSLKLLVLRVFLCLFLASGSNSERMCNAIERQALQSFQKSLLNYLQISWQSSSTDCCRWEGVKCSNKTQISRVTSIYVAPPLIFPGMYPMSGSINRSLVKLTNLEHLDLSSNSLDEIPPFLGSLRSLRYLDLSNTNVSGEIPIELGNLFRLEYLNLSGNSYANVNNLKWLSNLTSLEHLDLSLFNLSKAHDWLEVMIGLPKLKTLRLSGCDLPDPPIGSPDPPIGSPLISNSQSTLEKLDLQGNRLTDSIFPWLLKHSQTLSFIAISNNQLKGRIPEAFGTHMKLLQVFDLSHNQLEGVIPKSFGSLCSLRKFHLTGNRISGELTLFVESLSRCPQNFTPMRTLDLSDNSLNGSIPEVIGNLSELETLYLGGNSLNGVVSEVHFSNLSKLKNLNFSSNSLVLNFHDDWFPSFQLDNIRLSSLDLGPRFPQWIQTQTNYSNLDVSNTSISGSIPTWLWTGLSNKSCQINLSKNRLSGKLQNLSISFASYPEINLSSNQLEGPIPSFLTGAASLDLSNNKLSGSIDFLCAGMSMATAFDLSNNRLSGELPHCWTQFQSLLVLDLANNNFSGRIPNEIGSLIRIRALQLRNNDFSGYLPESLKALSNLEVLDLGGNRLSGQIPEWIGNVLPNLIVLGLRSNHFSGNITSQLCHLTRTQLFDLSGNNISGGIPKCLNNLTALTLRNEYNSNATIRIHYTSGVGSLDTYESIFDAESPVNWQGKVYEYKRDMNLGYMKCIDLSNNALTGEIPEEITDLQGMVSLNLSWNSLTGQIPHNIGGLEELNVLDLSNNRLSGEIPESLSQIHRLNMLDLSDNDLSGTIPKGTQLQGFSGSVYEGNPGLCGFPLKECDKASGTVTREEPEDKDHEGYTSGLGFYVSAGVGYVIGLWVVLGTLMLNKSMRVKYFGAITTIYDWLYVKVAIACKSRK